MHYLFPYERHYSFKKIGRWLLVTFCLLTNYQLMATRTRIIDTYLDSITVGRSMKYGNLKIFSLILEKELSTKDYVTLDEASEKNWLTIEELTDEDVNTIKIKNDGKEAVFIMKDEIIKGAKQDRMISQNILIPPNKTFIKVPVFCVEQGRWEYVSDTNTFKTANSIVPSPLRKSATIEKDQVSVWDEIFSSQTTSGVSSNTQTIMASYEDKEIKEQIDEYTKHFEQLPHLSKNIIGVVVTTGNRIVCCDIFANNSLFNKFWEKLIKSYAFDGIDGKESTVQKQKIKKFIAQMKKSNKVTEKKRGLGALYKLEANSGKGSVLIDESSAVHIDFWSQNSGE